eukprot:23676_1
MATRNIDIEEGSCLIVIFFLLLPVLICIIKDFSRDLTSYMQHVTTKRDKHSDRASKDDELDEQSSEVERASLLSESKDPNTELDDNGDVDEGEMIHKLRELQDISSSPVNVTLLDSKRNILAQTLANASLPELMLSPIMPAYEQCINVPIQPMQLMLWLLFLVLSYIALRNMVVSKKMRYNFKYTAVEMQDIFELCLRGIIVYIFGNIPQRFCVKFFLWLGWFVFFYPFVFQICPMTFTIQADPIKLDWTIIAICIFVGVSNLYIVLDNFHYVWKLHRWWIYGYSSFFMVVLYHIIFIKSANDDIDIQVHHHHWAFVLSLFLHSKKESSFVLHACMISVFIHGITVFGCENLFDYKNLEHSQVINV